MAAAALDEGDRDMLLALNNAHATELSWLTPEGFAAILASACYVRVLGRVDAALIAFDQSADYKSPNFLWWQSHAQKFVYVDRVVVAPAARRRGLARWLYADLFRVAAAEGHTMVTCEVNLDPPNPVSDAFHASLGFAEAGQSAPRDGKIVRYLARSLP
jgi:predicted GNAT superfamily acetyltransferase